MQKLKSKAPHQAHSLKHERLVCEVSIVADATPADKLHRSDIPGVVILRTEGKTEEADAVEADLDDIFTAPDDENSGDSQFGILIDLGEDKAEKVYSATVNSLATTATVTPEGNIALDVVGAGIDLETDDTTLLVKVEYKEK